MNLTPEQVSEIKHRIATTRDTLTKIAKDYSVCHTTIGRIRSGEYWSSPRSFTKGKYTLLWEFDNGVSTVRRFVTLNSMNKYIESHGLFNHQNIVKMELLDPNGDRIEYRK